MADTREMVLFDCDNTFGIPLKEIDDGLVLMYLLGTPEINLLGITTTLGNGTAPQAYAQTKMLLDLFQRGDIPLYQGADAPGAAPTPAARFLADSVARHPGQITVLATGPLGNLRAAAELNPHFFAQVKRLCIMGGNLSNPHIGWLHLPDLNFAKDPAAAHAVLHADCERSVFHMNICLQAPFRWKDMRTIRHWPSDLQGVLRTWLLAFGAYCMVGEFYLWDLLPAVYITHPDLFDQNPVRVVSTLEDMHIGRIITAQGQAGGLTNLPTRILDAHKFMDTLHLAWDRTLSGAK